MKKIIYVLAALVIVATLYVWASYNRFVGANEAIDSQWAQVETQYQRRFDLIPNLVESVKGVMKQEQKVFGDLAEARTQYAGAASIGDKLKTAGQVDAVLGRLLAIAENYPQLKSSENVQTLMVQLEGTENRLSVERKRFNDLVQAYNLAVKQFPSRIVAGWFSFGEKDYFEVVAGAEAVPKVEL